MKTATTNMDRFTRLAAALAVAAIAPVALAQTAPGARPANTTAATTSASDADGVGKAAKVKPTAAPTDPSAAMETRAPVDRNGAVPAERAARQKASPKPEGAR